MAHERIRPWIHRTPVLTSLYFNTRFHAEIYFKAEHLQKTGAFKARGAMNAVMGLAAEAAKRGVVTHSSGNHAQALAWASRIHGVPCTVVMPSNAPDAKRAAVRDYGADIVTCEPTLTSREETVAEIVRQTGKHLIPPYNDERVIAGQGTAALELFEDVADLDVMLAPVGGGGLMSGTAVVARAIGGSAINVVGAEPELAADARESLRTGIIQPPMPPVTIADGLRTSLGDKTFAHLQQHNVTIITAREESIREALILVYERLKCVVEPSATVTLGALLEQPDLIRGKRVGVILCGGNVDVRQMMK